MQRVGLIVWSMRLLLSTLGWIVLAGCAVDPPVCIAPREGGAPALKLSELGLFEDLRAQRPVAGVIPYQVAVSLYADGAKKHRFLALPPGEQLHYQDDRWVIPEGTLLVKTFYFPVDERDASLGETLIETRVMQQTAHGLIEGTYRWDASQTDATCSGGNEDVPVTWVDSAGSSTAQMFHIPGTSRCQTCHQSGDASHALGLRTRQMNVATSTGDQMDGLFAIGVLDRSPPAAQRTSLADPFGGAPLANRAESYLDVNCGNCHFAQGYAAGTGLFWDLGNASSAFCRKTPAVDGWTHVIVPGAPQQSEMLARMKSKDPTVRMPLFAVHIPDQRGIDLLTQWIAGLSPEVCP